MNNQMQAVAAQAAIGQEPVTRRVEFAITGDLETDFAAAILACFNQLPGMEQGPQPPTGDGNRMAQRVCEYLAQRFKAQAEANERHTARIEAMQYPAPDRTMSRIPPFPSPYDLTIGSTGAQSGTHSPSTYRPDSTGASPSCKPPFSFKDALDRLNDSLAGELGSDRKG